MVLRMFMFWKREVVGDGERKRKRRKGREVKSCEATWRWFGASPLRASRVVATGYS